MKRDVLEDVVKFQKMLGRQGERKVKDLQQALTLLMEECTELVEELVPLDGSDYEGDVDLKVINRRNIAKEASDVVYTLVALLVALDIPVIESIEKVNESNFSKFLPSRKLAESQLLGVRKKYGMTMDDIIQIKSSTVEGEDFYYFRRMIDGKMLKPLSYLEADMSMIPDDNIEGV